MIIGLNENGVIFHSSHGEREIQWASIAILNPWIKIYSSSPSELLVDNVGKIFILCDLTVCSYTEKG